MARGICFEHGLPPDLVGSLAEQIARARQSLAPGEDSGHARHYCQSSHSPLRTLSGSGPRTSPARARGCGERLYQQAGLLEEKRTRLAESVLEREALEEISCLRSPTINRQSQLILQGHGGSSKPIVERMSSRKEQRLSAIRREQE